MENKAFQVKTDQKPCDLIDNDIIMMTRSSPISPPTVSDQSCVLTEGGGPHNSDSANDGDKTRNAFAASLAESLAGKGSARKGRRALNPVAASGREGLRRVVNVLQVELGMLDNKRHIAEDHNFAGYIHCM